MCDTLAVLASDSRSGGVLFAKNSDRDYREAQFLDLVPRADHAPGSTVRLTYLTIDQAPSTHAALLSRPHWTWGAEMGANEHGLVIGNEAIFARTEASMAPQVIGMDYLRLALERAAEVDEAVEVITTLLRRHGQGGRATPHREMAYHNAYLIADPRGAKVLETVDHDWAVRPIAPRDAISNAMTIEAFRAAHQDHTKSSSGDYRRRRALTLLARPERVGVADAFRVLRDHQEGPPIDGKAGSRICAHRRENPIGQTTASWVSDLVGGRFIHWVTGTAAPCTGMFKPVVLELGLPPHGMLPAGEEDDASLWWRHERLRALLDHADASVRDAYARERDELETTFLLRMATIAGPNEAARRQVEVCWAEALAFEQRWRERLQG